MWVYGVYCSEAYTKANHKFRYGRFCAIKFYIHQSTGLPVMFYLHLENHKFRRLFFFFFCQNKFRSLNALQVDILMQTVISFLHCVVQKTSWQSTKFGAIHLPCLTKHCKQNPQTERNAPARPNSAIKKQSRCLYCT